MDVSKPTLDGAQDSEAGQGVGATAPAERCPVDHTAGGSAAPKAAAAPQRAPIPADSLPGSNKHALQQLVSYWRRPAAFVEENHKKYGSRFKVSIRIPPRAVYVISDPDEVRQMFLAPADVLHTGFGSATLEKYFGQTGLAWLDEEKHRVRRKLLMPSFHGSALERIEASIVEMAKKDIAGWQTGQAAPLHPLIHRFTLNVIREVIYGRVVPKQWPALLDLLTGMMRFNDSVGSAMMIHKMPPAAVKVLTAFRPLGLHTFLQLREKADALIMETIEDRRKSGETGDDMLAVLLGITHEDGSPLSMREVRDEMMTIFLAGTETTVAAITWSFEYLSHATEARERLVAEIDAGESDEYLTATVNEVLRLRPSIPQIIPREVMKPIEIGGVRYEPGMHLWASAYLMNRDPNLYPDPDVFRPERFLGVKPGTYTWIPFGGGRIRCLGDRIALMEMKTVIREVLSRYELHRADPRPEGTRSRIVVTVPEHGARLILRPREAPVSRAGV
ncbi:cytochrome P450 [Micromonospora sp. DT201]|uniref:cytochrome P450 n=1 Tax=Micromonospora sp. DT201 TaxID=3393442 RepID=UPI003CEF3D0F